MALKIGDKVRFLNTTGGGIIKRFISKELVSVEEDDGFETPVLIRECVVIESISSKNDILSTPKNSVSGYKNIEESSPKIIETRNGDSLNVVLAFLPMDEKNLQTTNYEAFLVNDSNYFIQYNYLSKQGNNWILRHSNTVEPNQQVFIEEFSKDQLNDLERICVQLISYKVGKPFELKNPVSVELKLDTVKFYKLHCFLDNEYFEDKAMLHYIVKKDQPERTVIVNPEEIAQAMKMKGDYQITPKYPINKSVDNDILEIDLHINELFDNVSGLSNTEMIKFQLEKFNQIMNENIRFKGKKIVFIHGKGEGVLRKAILDELKLKFKSCLFQDASFREYGFGATMVIIK